MSKPIFYDPSQKRQIIVKRIIYIIIFILFFLISIFGFSLLLNPYLPSPNIKNNIKSNHYRNINISGGKYEKTKKELEGVLEKQKNQITGGENDLIDIYAFYVERDDASFSSLKSNINKINTLIPERLNLGQTGIILLNPDRASNTLKYIKSQNNDIKILPLINNYDQDKNSRNGKLVYDTLSNTGSREKLTNQIIDYVSSNNLDGLNIDFENLDIKTRSMMVNRLAELRSKLKNTNDILTINVPLQDLDIPYKELSENVDKLIVMAYDEHRSSANPGSISSILWYDSGFNNLNNIIDPNKYIIALGNYGYDRLSGTNKSSTVTRQEAITTMNESSGEITYDDKSLNPMFEYYDDNDKVHQLRYLDATTAYNQIKIGRNLGQSSYAIRRLGGEDPGFWKIIDDKTLDNEEKPTQLEELDDGYDIQYEGSGLLLKLRNQPTSGSREIEYEKESGLITDQKITKFPSTYIIDKYSQIKDKNILLTFDDGPSTYTPQILDILSKYKITASFFIIGNNGELYPDILQKIYEAGSTIGNHTFTHPDISKISTQQLELELNVTQRLIQATTNHSTLLFRPPYSVDIEPTNSSEAEALIGIGNLGYYIVGVNIDSNDRENPGEEEIYNKTVGLVHQNNGGVILMHDGGGNRDQTIKALPKIISTLQSEGYKFVTADQAFGLSTGSTMPINKNSEKAISLSNRFIFNGSHLFIWIIYYIFILGIIIGLSRLLIIIILAIYQKYQSNKLSFNDNYKPFTSVIVPAYNEGVVIINTLKNLLESDYIDNLEIIFVDDGSTDNTLQLAIDNFGSNSKIKIISQINGGKSQALNNGIKNSKGEIIIVQDADTLFQKDAISLLIRHFENPKVGAVAGNVKVGNIHNLISRCQTIEYMTSQNLDRRAFDVLNCITVVPGAIGARRKIAIDQAGGLNSDTLAEDSDLTVTILENGRKIEHEQDAIARTEAPENINGFLKQRFRWMFGTLQVTWKHFDNLFSLNNPGLGRFALPNLFIFQLVFPLLSPVLDLIGYINLIILTFHLFNNYSQTVISTNYNNLILYLIFLFIDGIITIITFSMEKEKNISLALRFPIQKTLYRFLMYGIGLKVIYTAISGKGTGRNKLARSGALEKTHQNII